MRSKPFPISKYIKKSKYKNLALVHHKSTKEKRIMENLKINYGNHEIKPFLEGNFTEILEPYQNFALYPKDLQRIMYMSKSDDAIFANVRKIKVPNNQFSHCKKFDKLKLLVIGQENIVQSLLKEKYSITQKSQNLNEYLNYLNERQNLNNFFRSFLKIREEMFRNINNTFLKERFRRTNKSFLEDESEVFKIFYNSSRNSETNLTQRNMMKKMQFDTIHSKMAGIENECHDGFSNTATTFQMNKNIISSSPIINQSQRQTFYGINEREETNFQFFH